MTTVDIKITIHANDRKIAAMVKALAFEVDGPKSVEGATKEFLETHRYLVFHFKSHEKADAFRDALIMYLPGIFAQEQLQD
jgi:hypothetical protein